jgi:hypothetical protein
MLRPRQDVADDVVIESAQRRWPSIADGSASHRPGCLEARVERPLVLRSAAPAAMAACVSAPHQPGMPHLLRERRRAGSSCRHAQRKRDLCARGVAGGRMAGGWQAQHASSCAEQRGLHTPDSRRAQYFEVRSSVGSLAAEQQFVLDEALLLNKSDRSTAYSTCSIVLQSSYMMMSCSICSGLYSVASVIFTDCEF